MSHLARTLLRSLLVVVLTAVAGLHLQILAARLADGSVLEPMVVARWLASVAVALVFLRYRRSGLSLLRGRPALVFWVVVALLHAVPSAPAAQAVPGEVFLLATPLGLTLAAACGAGVALTTGSRSASAHGARRALTGVGVRCTELGRLAPAGPRAPPG